MHSVTRWVSALAALALLSMPASAESPPKARSLSPTTTTSPAVPCPEPAVAEPGALESEQREFEAAAERYARFAELTRHLAEEVELEREQVFDAEVDLYVKKRELTRALTARNEPAAPPVSAPAW